MSIQTANWFAAEPNQPNRSGANQYVLIAPFSMDPSRPPSLSVVDAVAAVTDPSGQTTLTLYEYLDPDAFDDIIDASSEKRSHVEVRFTVEEYLVLVRSSGTILIYEQK